MPCSKRSSNTSKVDGGSAKENGTDFFQDSFDATCIILTGSDCLGLLAFRLSDSSEM